MSDRSPLRRVGAIWKPKPASKSFGSGSLTINGLRQRFIILKNDRKEPGSAQPDYVLMSSDEPEADERAGDRQSAARIPARDESNVPF
jgi:hypothetical protein